MARISSRRPGLTTEDSFKRKARKADVKAAGGVVIRQKNGRHKVAIVHRPRYRDWSLPKGKLEEGEKYKAGALREVAEETGYRCELGIELPRRGYRLRNGKWKVVRWWVMYPCEGKFKANREVDRLKWVSIAGARKRLTYKNDVALVERAWKRLKLPE